MNPSVRGARALYCHRLFAICLLLIFTFWLQTPDSSAAEGTNTIVRFEFIRGTNTLGQTDVEQFAQEKPETMRIFLLYVRSGAYTNLIIHALVPGFVVQGGGLADTHPS